jgi:hypothetical protein
MSFWWFIIGTSLCCAGAVTDFLNAGFIGGSRGRIRLAVGHDVCIDLGTVRIRLVMGRLLGLTLMAWYNLGGLC